MIFHKEGPLNNFLLGEAIRPNAKTGEAQTLVLLNQSYIPVHVSVQGCKFSHMITWENLAFKLIFFLELF